MDFTNVISLLSGVALFLFGMTLMGDGLKRVAGNRLELVLYRLTNTPLKSILLGTAVTTVIQSSSATSVMVVGFVNSGMMKFKNASGIVLGAILGTSITGWVICLSGLEGASGWISIFSTATITGATAVVGIILRMFCQKPEKRHLGDILLGFAVLMFGMSAMSDAVSPLRESERFLDLMTTFSSPLLGILVGTLFTCVIQSASAAVGILQALAVTGVVTFSTALPIIMGISIGASLPVLLSALDANVGGRRTAFIYLLIDFSGSLLLGSAFYLIHAIHPFTELMETTMTMVTVSGLNTIFRLLMVLLFAPLLGVLQKITCTVIREKQTGEQSDDLQRLEERFAGHPTLALEQCRLTINEMAAEAQKTMETVFAVLDRFTPEGLKQVQELESLVDRYEDVLGTYLMKITSQELTEKQNKDVSKYLHTLSDFERISDHARNLGECAEEIHEKGIDFSESAKAELTLLRRAITEILSLTIQGFVQNDLTLATKVEPLEEVIDGLCDQLKLHHIERLQKGDCTLHQGFVFNDLLINFERIADHCSNIAVAMIELESDVFDTHRYLDSLKGQENPDFARCFGEYKTKYRL